MACACRNKNKSSAVNSDITAEPVTLSAEKPTEVKGTIDDITVEPITANKNVENKQITLTPAKHAGVLQDAKEINLEQCYLCAKKHVSRARDFFEEYHTKYPDHIKNLIESVRVAEQDVMRAFLLWQRVMSQMNMGEGELLGNDLNRLTMRKEHIALANRIRDERIKLSDDPLYSPDFDTLLVEIHLLQHKVLDNG